MSTAPAPPAKPASQPPSLQARVDTLVEGIRQNPNHPALIDAIQKILAETNRTPAVQRLLFEWYTLPQLQPNVKGVLLVLIVNTIRQDAQLADQVAFGLDPATPAYKAIHRGIKYHLDNAVESLSLVARLQNNQYTIQDSPKFIVAVPKSGSSLLGLCLGNMVRLVKEGQFGQNPFEWRGYPAWWDIGVTHDWDLRPEIGVDPLFLRYPGGVYKGHIPPTAKNLHTLRLYPQSRYVVILREPRDQLAAWLCHALRSENRTEPLTPDEVHARLDRMIGDGTLLESLHFAGKWLAMRDPKRSIVVTYEELVNEPLAVLRRMRELYQLELTDAQLEQVYEYATPVTNRETGQDGSGHDRRIYPLGWTGHIGVHRGYSSPDNVTAFRQAFEAFCQLSPWGEPIAQIYPALRA